MKHTIDKLKAQASVSRKLILEMIYEAGSGHPGGSLSAIDIITTLFFHEMKFDVKNPNDLKRDRFVLSKGHAVPALYATLAYCGFFEPKKTLGLRKLNSVFQGHPDRVRLPVVEASTGSLGQGLSVAIGMALAAKLDKRKNRIYCLIGDGETQEGQIWEALMCAGNYKLDNLCVILDHNKYQIDGAVEDIMNLTPLKDKFEAFKWNTITINGHDFEQILDALKKTKTTNNKPSIIIANTIKGKGVSFMEIDNKWHGVAPNKEELSLALKEIENN